MPNIEIESRAILSSSQRDATLQYMRSQGPIRVIQRVMIDFSGKNRQRTVTLRINDGIQELVAKSGGLADNIRQEALIPLPANTSLETSLLYFNLLGYSDAMISLRTVFVVRTEKLEYSVRDVLTQDNHKRVSTLLDIELLDINDLSGVAKTDQALRDLNLTPLDKAAWGQWVTEMYEKVDRPFHYSDDTARILSLSLQSLWKKRPLRRDFGHSPHS